MALTSPAARRHLHTRRIVCEGFQREDGIYDIEAQIVDTKTYGYDHRKRGRVEAGTPVHDMQLRLTVDDRRVVHAIEVSTNTGPYVACASVAPAFQALVGRSVATGWRRSVNDALGGEVGCTHLRELLMPVATVAFQTMEGGQKGVNKAAVAGPDAPKPFFMNTCKAWSQHGELVKEMFPRYYLQPVE